MVLASPMSPMTPHELADRQQRQQRYWEEHPDEARRLQGVITAMESSYGVESWDMWYQVRKGLKVANREIADWLRAWETLQLGGR